MNMFFRWSLFINLLFLTACAKELDKTKALSAYYNYLQAISNEDYTEFLKVTQINPEYSEEIFEGRVFVDRFTKTLISNFGKEGVEEYFNQKYGDFVRGFLITDPEVLESPAYGISVGQEDGVWIIDTYPVGIHVVTLTNGHPLVNIDITVTDYEVYMEKVFRPIVHNCRRAINLIEDNKFVLISDFMDALANDLED